MEKSRDILIVQTENKQIVEEIEAISPQTKQTKIRKTTEILEFQKKLRDLRLEIIVYIGHFSNKSRSGGMEIQSKTQRKRRKYLRKPMEIDRSINRAGRLEGEKKTSREKP